MLIDPLIFVPCDLLPRKKQRKGFRSRSRRPRASTIRFSLFLTPSAVDLSFSAYPWKKTSIRTIPNTKEKKNLSDVDARVQIVVKKMKSSILNWLTNVFVYTTRGTLIKFSSCRFNVDELPRTWRQSPKFNFDLYSTKEKKQTLVQTMASKFRVQWLNHFITSYVLVRKDTYLLKVYISPMELTKRKIKLLFHCYVRSNQLANQVTIDSMSFN